jgi:aquaporin Z
MVAAWRSHWPEYLIEATGLGLFMIAACLATALVEYPTSPVRMAIADALPRRALLGLLMGLTAVALTYSSWGRRSGAHFNPSFTLTFFGLGKIAPVDACFYVGAQFVGGAAGVAVASAVLGARIMHPTVDYVVTRPGSQGVAAAFLAEVAISFGLMLVVLMSSNTPRVARYTGVLAGLLITVYIALEAPLSGMSMNPARTFGSALPAGQWAWLWIYFIAPPLGMSLAAMIYRRLPGHHTVVCAKLHHPRADQPCIFHCGYRQGAGEAFPHMLHSGERAAGR